MSFLRDKHTRWYCIFLFSLLIISLFAAIKIADRQTKAAREIFFAHDNAIATALLEQGISEDIIAKALTSKEESASGSSLLNRIGFTESMDINRLSISSVKDVLQSSLLRMELLIGVLLFGGTLLFLRDKEKLYQKSEETIRNYIDGNYAVRLPQTSDGTFGRMLSSVEQLATMLQSQTETERNTKEFLKAMISDISHQLKTPLSALMMYQEIIESEPDNSDTVKEFSVKTGTALKRIEQLIQSMLKITRLDTGSILFKKGYYSISNVISNAISELTTRTASENKEIIIDGAEHKFFCDMEWTSEAIGNIVKNALDHTDSGGIIRISWERTPAMFRILISDNGHGIAPEDIHHIFKRFYQSRNDRHASGVGLGLPLAKAIMEGQGGFLSVQSEYSQGTTFTLSFLTES